MRILLAFCVVLLVISGSFYLTRSPARDTSGYGEAHIGGAFTLTGTQGHVVHDSDFRGRLMLVYMGYSNCPDICPMTLITLGDVLKALGPDADKVAVIFITLDPERDTPEVLGDYLKSFDRRIIGLTGSKDEIENVVRAYKVYYSKNPPSAAGSYLVDHSGILYLMDRQGKYLVHFAPDIKSPELSGKIRQHL